MLCEGNLARRAKTWNRFHILISDKLPFYSPDLSAASPSANGLTVNVSKGFAFQFRPGDLSDFALAEESRSDS